ncbi:putative nesprin-1 isoform X3 [Apostichopus japonicus]|uniref:Putative nesprin-1 isoform X3 n=1 Tax=Stichopus japonicus TaxID=307972 RepID=A0A2G8KXH8_STIJA|nr:putative nesprin-1 isoform X3 [Apostichopus japonicus]
MYCNNSHPFAVPLKTNRDSFRVKKLEDTLRAVQQLEKDTNDLRRWLSKVERELSTPETYTSCNLVEIQAKLKVQQELQKDIERHSSSVSSVLSLCEMLLHDNDACSTDADSEALRVTERSLDHRWNNICKLSLERKTKIEETWRLWQKFLEDYSGFADWLTKSEDMLSHPLTVVFVVIKEEVKKFEAFQRKIHENLAQLEMINKQYRRMARESRTDTNLQLRKMVHEANNRWDDVARRCNKVLRRMKALLTQKEEFDSTRESMIVWLTEMDLQLTNVEHFSESEVSIKVKQMKAFQQEIELNRSRMDEIDDFSKGLMQRCDPSDAATIQEDLDDLHRYADEVFARVSRFQKKLQRLSFAELADIDQMSSGDDGVTTSTVTHQVVILAQREETVSPRIVHSSRW